MVENEIAWLIFARARSKRLPNKCYLKIKGEVIIERLINKAVLAGIKKKDIFLCTSDDESCEKLSQIARDKDINVLFGSEDFPIQRICNSSAIEKLEKYSNIVRICGDSPLYSFNLVKRAYYKYTSNFKDFFCITNIRKRNFPNGLSIELYSFKNLYEMLKLNTNLQEEEHMSELIKYSKMRVVDIITNKNLRDIFPEKLTFEP